MRPQPYVARPLLDAIARGRGLAGALGAAIGVTPQRTAMTNPLAPSSLLTPLLSSAAMRAILDDRARLQRMLDVIVALARAEAAVGVIPALASDQIANAAKAERYDLTALGEEAVAAGNIAVPLISALTAEVAKTDAAAAGFVQWGATGQDIIDSALVLELRAAIDALNADLNRAIDGFTTLAGRHRRTPMVGRTGMQHALPMPFGLKLAGYAAALARSRERLRRLRREALMLQLGGAVGTLATLGEKASMFPSGWPPCSTCPCPRRPGTATATGWPRSRPRSPSSPAPAARSPATCRS
jgi:3-carboxy-cis,cis-muconate cycloisomerase